MLGETKMKAEETIMSWEKMRMLMADNNKHNRGGESRVEKYCEAQAKISYKKGIEEVVAWIRSHQLIEPSDDSVTRFEPFYQIEQAKLKKWEKQ